MDLGANRVRGKNLTQKVPYLESATLIYLFTIQILWATMMIKGCLLLIVPIVKHFQAMLGQILMFLGLNRVLALNVTFITPKRHILARLHVF